MVDGFIWFLAHAQWGTLLGLCGAVVIITLALLVVTRAPKHRHHYKLTD